MALSRGSRTQAVKGVDPKSTGLCPRRFESCRLRVPFRSGETTPGGTRTHNLWLRKPTPYPLGYRGCSCAPVRWATTQRSSIGRACDCRCSAITGSLVRFRPLRAFGQCDRTQVVTGLDLKSSGLCPRRFEPCRSRALFKGDTNRREGGIEPLRVQV